MWLFNKIQQRIFNNFINSKSDTLKGEVQMSLFANDEQYIEIYNLMGYELTTNNTPLVTTKKNSIDGFKSPFIVDLYLVNTKQFMSQRYIIPSPFMTLDTDFRPIRLRAFGSYGFCEHQNPIVFVRNIHRTKCDFIDDSITEQVCSFVVTSFVDYLAETKIANLDLLVNLNEFSRELTDAMKDVFSENGVELSKLLIENISFAEVLEVVHGKCTSVGVIGNMTTYTQMQFVDPFKGEAKN